MPEYSILQLRMFETCPAVFSELGHRPVGAADHGKAPPGLFGARASVPGGAGVFFRRKESGRGRDRLVIGEARAGREAAGWDRGGLVEFRFVEPGDIRSGEAREAVCLRI